jgi:hypothetical protein
MSRTEIKSPLMREWRNMQRVDDAPLLTYRVTGRWAHEEAKRLALASNVYVKRDGAWKLASALSAYPIQ